MVHQSGQLGINQSKTTAYNTQQQQIRPQHHNYNPQHGQSIVQGSFKAETFFLISSF